MKSLSIVLLALLLIGLSLAYTPEQQTTLDGMRLSFQLGVAYQQASQGQNLAAYNALVEQYNAWVREHFGEDPNLLMSGNAPNLQKPYATGKNLSNNGMVHAIDASGKYGPEYTTNDINLLSDSAISRYVAKDTDENGNRIMGDGYLSGI